MVVYVPCTDSDDFFFGGGPVPDEKPSRYVTQDAPVQLKPSRVAGRIQVRMNLAS